MTTWTTKVDGPPNIVWADHVNRLQTYKLDKDAIHYARPEDYGGKPDDPAYDNHDAIMSAISDASEVQFFKGVYYSSPLHIINKHGCRVCGTAGLRRGMANYGNASVIRSIAAQTELLYLAGHEMTFEDISFDGDLKTSHVIYMAQYSSLNMFFRIVVERATELSGYLVFLDALDAGGNVQCDQSYWLRSIIAQDITIATSADCLLHGADKAIYAKGTNSNIHKFDRCLIGGAHTLYHSYGGDAGFFNCDLQSAWTETFLVQGNASLRIQECYTECDRAFLRMTDTLPNATPIILINNQLNQINTNLYIIPKVPVILIGNRFNADVNIAEVPIEADGKNVVAIGNSWATACNYFAGEGAKRWLTSIDNYDESGNLLHSRDESQDITVLPFSVHKPGAICWYTPPTDGGSPGWVCVGRNDTAVAAEVSVGENQVQVADATGIAIGDTIGIVCDVGSPRTIQWSIVSDLLSGNIIEFLNAFIAGEVASIGNTVYTMRWQEMTPLVDNPLAPMGTDHQVLNITGEYRVAGDKVVGARVIDPDLAYTVPGSGATDLELAVAALINVVTSHGLGEDS